MKHNVDRELAMETQNSDTPISTYVALGSDNYNNMYVYCWL